MKSVVGIAAIVLLAGCAAPVTKYMNATGGSKADGIVKMSYEYGLFEAPRVDKEQALVEATSRCTGWGYTGAEPFGSETRQCTNFNTLLKDCDQWTATVQYQCTGQAK